MSREPNVTRGRAWVLALGLVTALFCPDRVAGQAAPALLVEAPGELAADRARFERFDTASFADIVRFVGLDAPGPAVRVVLAEPASDWARAVPPWAMGYAVGEQGLVVLIPSRSPVYPHDTLEDVLRHEIAHVLIARAARGGPVPRWFHEGVAVAAERAWDLEDRTRLVSALVFGPRLDLAAIDRLFLGNEGEQQRAYLLSAALVRHLMAAHGPGAPAAVLRTLAEGRPFDYALANATAQSPITFETAFWDAQRTWTTWMPLLASSTVLWFGVMGLAWFAARRRRQRSAELRRAWDEADARPADPEPEPGPQTPDPDD